MPRYEIRGIDVDFPFDAYECQLVYMEKVIESLQTKSNALLESPTGTGKTLCLLCATLAWRRSLGEFSRGGKVKRDTKGSQHMDDDELPKSQSSEFPTIIYTSRTHSQIKQVIQELRRTNYRPRMTVLGSREQLCIHEDVSLLRGKAQTSACKSLCKKSTKKYCRHVSRVTEFLNSNSSIGDDPIDIEDLMNLGRSSGACPYYMSRDLHKDADIIFSPYNYLIDRNNSKTLKDIWNNSILIFDEAHNLESLCAEAASFDLPSSLLLSCTSEAKKCADLAAHRQERSGDGSCNPDNFAILRALLLKLEKRINEIQIESKEHGFTRPGPYIYELLAELNITKDTVSMLVDTIHEGCKILEEETKIGEVEGLQKATGAISRLQSIADIFQLIFRDNTNAHAEYYRVHVQEVEASATDVFRGKTSRILSWWCFNPGIAMEEFSKLGVGSIILTSGTLSPMDSFAQELKLNFPIRLENPHVISGNQIWAGVAPVGPSGYPFNSSFRSRDTAEYKLELGNAIVNFARIVPDGLLVFFPSYYILDRCISFWKTESSTNSTTIWERMCKLKLPVVEPRESSLFPMAVDEYTKNLKNTSSGSVFFAVCRGKASEGLDFADHAGRAVVVTGIPFATAFDPKVRLKREYLDQQTQNQKSAYQCKSLTGEEWYSQQASRAVNQAVGRVIRHRHDYGAIIFCDERFTHANRQSQVSSWIRPHIKLRDIVYTLTRFFREGRTNIQVKPEVIKSGIQEHSTKPQVFQDVDSYIEKPLLKMGTRDATHSSVTQSSSIQLKQTIISSHLNEIVPANRSLMASEKFFGGSFFKSFSEAEPQSSNDKKNPFAAAPGLVKKRKLPASMSSEKLKASEAFEHSMKISEKKADGKTPKEPHGVANELNAVASGKEEIKGAAFLSQVRKMLSEAEYKEFVEFLRALKSKEKGIGHVLESISRLFSAPDRLPLLQGFKDFVPSKFQPLYDRVVRLKLKTQDKEQVDLTDI